MKIVLVLISKEENNYINEWIKWHLSLGFDKIVIYDNSDSKDEKIETAINEEYLNKIDIIPYYDIKSAQFLAYNDAYKKYSMYDYIMFLDTDEFLILKKHKSIHDLILSIKIPFETIRFNWEMYDDNDIIERNVEIPVMKAFDRKSVSPNAIKLNYRTKHLLKTNINGININSSHMSYKTIKGKFKNLITVLPSGKDITLSLPNKKCIDLNIIDDEVARVNHYITKSLSEFIAQKMKRGDVAFGDAEINNYYWLYNIKTPEKIEYLKNKKIL